MKDLFYVRTLADNVNLLGSTYSQVTINWFCTYRSTNPLEKEDYVLYDSTRPSALRPAGNVWNQLFAKEEAYLLCQHLSFPGWISLVLPYYTLPLSEDKRGFAWAAGDKGCYVQLHHDDPSLPQGIQGHIELKTCYALLGTHKGAPHFS